MNIKKKVEKVKETVKGKTIPKDLYDKIMVKWNELPLYRRLPTVGNMKKFFKDINLSKEEQKIFLDAVKKR